MIRKENDDSNDKRRPTSQPALMSLCTIGSHVDIRTFLEAEPCNAQNSLSVVY